MENVASLFPLKNQDQSPAQELARRKFRSLTAVAREIKLALPDKAELEDNEEGTLDIKIELPAHGFTLDYGIDNWNGKDGPMVGWTLRFADDSINVLWSVADGWEAVVHTTGETLNAARVIALAMGFRITAAPGNSQQLMQQEAEAIVARGFLHYNAHKIGH